MKYAFSGGRAVGCVLSPPSKSHTHRAFLLAASADGKSRIDRCLFSQDTLSTLRAIEATGARFEKDEASAVVVIDGAGKNRHAPTDIVDVENSGTTMRLFSGLVSVFDTPVTITGDASLRKRPMRPLLDALAQAGVSCSAEDGGRPPVVIKGPNRGGVVRIPGNMSSQFVSSLLMTAPLLDADTTVIVEGRLVSAPYIDITVHMMRLYGADVSLSGSTGERTVFSVRGGTGYRPFDYRVPGDFSAAAFPLVAGALAGKVSVGGLDMTDPQGDKAVFDLLKRAGANVSVSGDTVTAEKPAGRPNAIDADMGGIPDLFPITAVLLSTASGTSRLYGAPQLRFKESDRIASTAAMLNALGADVTPTDDGCIIRGVDRLSGGTIWHHGDHRVMMAAAVASYVSDGPVVMDDAECCFVSYPGFIDRMKELGMAVEIL